jgi:TP901 family phage tail tape measure protein
LAEFVTDTVVGRIRLDTSEFQASLQQAGRAASGFASALQGALIGAGMAGATALGGFVSQAVRVSGELDRLRKQTIALAGGVPEVVNRAFGQLPNLARATGVAATEAARSLYFVASAGIRGAESMELVETAAKASAAGLGDMADITRVLVAAMNVWGKENLSAARAADVLLAAVREGVLEPQEMAQSLGRLLPVAKQMGLDFAKTAGMVAAFTRAGLDAAEAVTAFRAVLVQLIQATPETRKALQEAGTSLQTMVQLLRSGNVAGFLAELDRAFRNNADAVQRAFGDVRSLVGVLNLVGEGGKTAKEVIDAVSNSAGDLEQAFRATEGRGREIKRALEELEDAGIKLADPIVKVAVPAFREFAKAVGSSHRWHRRRRQGCDRLGGSDGRTSYSGYRILMGRWYRRRHRYWLSWHFEQRRRCCRWCRAWTFRAFQPDEQAWRPVPRAGTPTPKRRRGIQAKPRASPKACR